MSREKTILIFHASKEPNENGKLNWYEFKSYPKIDLKILQDTIGGSITLLPNIDPERTRYIAYADDEGLLKHAARNGLFCVFFCIFSR